ncbi:putative toxin-antitoxin system toxin component, PIN family [Synechocystis sp. PCC 6714]|uniref:putative toxin-antitoxin system toxin component, PIN family n=1 Tax=Synechocystis sp. (strain PCC 6714) TaxID=1147 RepID=UPI003510288E
MGKILYSEATLLELKTVLNRKKFDKYLTLEEKQQFIFKFIEKAELVHITETITDCRDPKDNKFLELAVSGQANLLITGDQDLLILHPFRTLKIITVADFLNQTNWPTTIPQNPENL